MGDAVFNKVQLADFLVLNATDTGYGKDVLLTQWHEIAWCLSLKAVPSLTLSQWSSSGNPVAIQCAWNLDPSVHWNTTGERIVGTQCVSSVLPVVFQWSSSVFQLCKLTLDRHWDTTGC